jgi:hypothetical protein
VYGKFSYNASKLTFAVVWKTEPNKGLSISIAYRIIALLADEYPIQTVRTNGLVYASPIGSMTGLTGPCIIVFNLDEARMNCDRVFALFGLYGDVVKVRAGIGKGISSFLVRCAVTVISLPLSRPGCSRSSE